MFKFLKDKLKSWVSKNSKSEEEAPEVKKPVEKETKKKTSKPKKQEKKTIDKKSKEKTDSKTQKEKKVESKKKEKEIPDKKQKSKKTKEIPKEEPEKVVEEIKEVIKEKKGFFGIFKKKKEEVEEEIPEEEIKPKEEPEKKSFFQKFKKKLDYEKFEEMFSELEMILLQNNVAYDAVQSIKLSLEEQLVGKNISEVNLENALKISIEGILINPPNIIEEIKKTLEVKKPYVIAFVGINGSGKTTTIAKTTHMLKKQGFTVCLAAADTFRAAAIQQLEEHANKLNVPIIKKDYGADPASVGFEAIQYAKKHHIDIVLIDTAGRMNTKDSLMIEMEKIIRVNKPDMKIFVGESITGNDATEQAKAFNDAIDLTGIILSKADVDEKGGTAISVSHVTKKPVLFLGMGQTYDDLEVFDKDKLIEKLGL